eukprot:COSAG02_NODE_9758_length_2119_cov_2.077723_1_plen_25_part_10
MYSSMQIDACGEPGAPGNNLSAHRF